MSLRGRAGLSVRNSAVPGRLRLSVAGLKRNPARKPAVERVFSSLPGVRAVSGSTLTGNVLVLFDPAQWKPMSLVSAAEQQLNDEFGTDSPAIDPREDRPQPSPPPWHAMPAPEVARLLTADPDRGLNPQEAASRLRQFGANRLPEPYEPSLLQLLARQFFNAPTLTLGAGAALSLITGAVVDAALIGGVLVANALIGAATERSGQRAIAALRRAAPVKARVQREGTILVVDAQDLVPGDTVLLLPGDPVPADGRVWEAHRLQLEESALTGESRPATKSPDPVEVEKVLADHRSMVYRGTTVVGGRGRAIVVGTGARTAIGQLHLLAAEAETPPTPLKRDLDQIGRRLVVASTGVSLGVMGLALIRGTPLARALGTAVALGVAALPEGLPATATTVLALSSGRMRQRGTLIRSLHAAEALGSVTVVCADKTGTITENRMSVGEIRVDGQRIRVTGPALSTSGSLVSNGRRVHREDDPALSELLKIGVLCSDAEVAGIQDEEIAIDGSSTEGALLVAAMKAGLQIDDLRLRYPRIDRRDRGNGRRYMVTVHRGPEGLVALIKGAPDELLEICDEALIDGQLVPLDSDRKAIFRQRNADMAGQAMRVLAFGRRELPEGYQEDDLYRGFVWCGLAGLTDPVRASAPDAVRALRRAGIRTVMITGDQAATASAVARQLGLERGGPLHVLEAGDLAGMDPEVLRGLVGPVEVFARTPPEMKLAIVRALQAGGEIAAMTGDGVNDAPALRAADVGVAMGQRGTELAKELADVVLSTDDFSRMVDAVEEGRLVRANVRRVLHYLLATNGSEVWTVALAVAMGLSAPLTPAQLLWLNLISDLTPALGLAMEPRDPDLMKRPPRDPREPIIPPSLQRRILGESAALATGPMAAYGLGILRHGQGSLAQSMAFWSLALADLLHVALARAGTRPALSYQRGVTRPLALGVGISGLLQLGVLLLPSLRSLLGTSPLGLVDGLISLAGGLAPIAAIEIQRSFGRALPAPEPIRRDGELLLEDAA